MTFKVFHAIFDVTCSLLPRGMNSPEAKAMLSAIALQESRFEHRRQIKGPARGFWQFELGGGVRGVLTHKGTSRYIKNVLDALVYDYSPATSHAVIEHNDVLACAYARLLLWTVPDPLPKRGEHDEAWDQYIEGWRPGKPHRATWNAFYDQAWNSTDGGIP